MKVIKAYLLYKNSLETAEPHANNICVIFLNIFPTSKPRKIGGSRGVFTVVKSNRSITEYLASFPFLQYTVSRETELEFIFMSHPIVPLETPQSRRFDKKKKNEIIFRRQLKELDFSLLFYLF